MIIKRPDGRKVDLAALHRILARTDLDEGIRAAAQDEIYRIERGLKGESEARYQIDFHFGTAKNWAVLHDLRINLGQGRIAQIDHLVINRFMDFWVCESKFKSGSLSVNEHGEFSVLTARGPIGIASPIEQGRRQASVLEEALRTKVKMPRRFWIRNEPIIESLVLVSRSTIIQRSQGTFEGSECLIKNDAVRTTVTRRWKVVSPMVVAKMFYWFADRLVSSRTLERIAGELAALHVPASYDWERILKSRVYAKPAEASGRQMGEVEIERNLGGSLVCEKCGDAVSRAVAKYCLANQVRFAGRIYCYSDQKDF